MKGNKGQLPISRRSILATTAVGLPLITAGCSMFDDDNSMEETETENDETEASEMENDETEETETENDDSNEGERGDEDEETESEAANLLVSDQTERERITIDKIETEVNVKLEIVDGQDNDLAPTALIEAGSTLEEYSVSYTNAPEKEQDVTARLVHDDTGVIATSSATVRPNLIELKQGEVMLIEANPDRGFNYPYYAYVPEGLESSGPVFVEPNNTGTSTDSFQEHRTRAESLLEPDDWRRKVPEYMGVPFLVPVFPRPQSEPRDWRHYVHALDAETMAIEDGPLEQVDLQLLEMVDHYRESLGISIGYDAVEEFHMNGFSASGNFVNRFTALHPERVKAVTAGGINGTLILPRESDNGRSIPYPIGVENVPELTGDEFAKETWTEVPQFIYIGAEDENDTIPYDDAWNDRLREIALDVYGENIHSERIPYCRSIYENAGANAQIHVYQNIGHSIPRWVRRDVYQFHKHHMDHASEFEPIDVRDAPTLDISFSNPPRGGDTEIAVQISVPEYYMIDDKFSDGSISLMLDTGDEIEWGDRIMLTGNRHVRPHELPVGETRTIETERPLNTGEQITIGIMDGNIITSETVSVK